MNTQIYATFGPACRKEDTIKQMIETGMTGMRLNLSHTTLRESEEYLMAYQKAADICGVSPQILIDMQGPELRVGKIQEPITLVEGSSINLSNGEIPIPECVAKELEQGDEILLDDGKLLLKVERIQDESIFAKVLRGGILKSGKSIKVCGKDIYMPALTEHDIENIKVAKQYGVTALMQPFVRGEKDLIEVRETLRRYGADDIKIYAKIENQIGIKHLEEIASQSDVIIIARGDLGNDMPLWELPAAQHKIEKICHKLNKPYIVVTQMLASMETQPVPTRAEVSDIYHAVFNGAYGVMITAESAIGKYPVEAVHFLANTAHTAEAIRE